MSVDAEADEIQCLVGALRWLALTSCGGEADIQAAVERLLNALLDLQAFREGEHDPRRQRSLDLAQRIQAARAAGVDVDSLAERYGRSPKTIYRLSILKTSRDKFPVKFPAVKTAR